MKKIRDTKWYLQAPDIAFLPGLQEERKLRMFLNQIETEFKVH